MPSVAVNPQELFDYDTDSDKVSDILEDDLERGSAVLAAFVVTLITVTFFGTLVAMLSVTMSLSGDYQVSHIYTITTYENSFFTFKRDELSPMVFASRFQNGRASLEMEQVGATTGSLIIILTGNITVPVLWF